MQYEKKLNALNKKYESLKSDSDARVKVLEDALEYHTNEMGLSGQADLLSKIASLRGEVSALKGDLTTNHRKLGTYIYSYILMLIHTYAHTYLCSYILMLTNTHTHTYIY